MDDLDKQLAELQLLNNADLLSNSSMSNNGTLGKKIGPAVPPKPKKQQPQVCFYCLDVFNYCLKAMTYLSNLAKCNNLWEFGQ